MGTSEIVSSDSTRPSFNLKYKTIFACSISLGDEVIISGGQSSWNTVSRYDRDGWVEYLPSLKVGRSSHGCTQYSSRDEQVLLVIGGYNGNNFLDTTEILRPGSDWEVITSARLPRPMNGVRAITVDNRVLIFGGRDTLVTGPEGNYFDDIWELTDSDA